MLLVLTRGAFYLKIVIIVISRPADRPARFPEICGGSCTAWKYAFENKRETEVERHSHVPYHKRYLLRDIFVLLQLPYVAVCMYYCITDLLSFGSPDCRGSGVTVKTCPPTLPTLFTYAHLCMSTECVRRYCFVFFSYDTRITKKTQTNKKVNVFFFFVCLCLFQTTHVSIYQREYLFNTLQ